MSTAMASMSSSTTWKVSSYSNPAPTLSQMEEGICFVTVLVMSHHVYHW